MAVAITQNRRRTKPEELRAKLLDAAEKLFAERGYHAVSVRDIVAEAGLKLSMLTYHFASKEDLFAQVVSRRSSTFIGQINDSLGAAMAAAGKKAPTVEAIVRAYLTPSFDLAMSGEGWKNYIQLITRSMGIPQNEAMLERFWIDFKPSQKSLLAAFRAACPDSDEEALNWAVYFLVAATIHIHSESLLVEQQSEGLCRASDLPRMLELMVPYFAAGIERVTKAAKPLRRVAVKTR